MTCHLSLEAEENVTHGVAFLQPEEGVLRLPFPVEEVTGFAWGTVTRVPVLPPPWPAVHGSPTAPAGLWPLHLPVNSIALPVSVKTRVFQSVLLRCPLGHRGQALCSGLRVGHLCRVPCDTQCSTVAGAGPWGPLPGGLCGEGNSSLVDSPAGHGLHGVFHDTHPPATCPASAPGGGALSPEAAEACDEETCPDLHV